MTPLARAGTGGLAALVIGATAGIAAEPFEDFTFRRVKPPAEGTKRFITIQIAPKKAATPPESVATVDAAPTDYAWFWQSIRPERSAAAPGRFLAASALPAPEGADRNAPRLEALRAIAAAKGPEILLATLGTRVSPALVLAMIGVLDAGDMTRPYAGTRAAGPETLEGGIEVFSALLARYDSDPILALAAFHAGAEAVEANAGVPPDAATRAFVPRVVAGFQVARALCITPPELYSDGCVFSVEEPDP